MNSVGILQNRLRSFLLYSNSHIPLIAFALVSSTWVVFNLEVSWPLAVVASCGAFVVYQLDRVWFTSPEDLINQPGRVKWYRDHSSYQYVSIGFCGIIGFAALFFLKPVTLWMGLLLGSIGMIYLMPYGSQFARLKGHWLAKPLFISICWSFGGVLLPLIESGERVNGMVWSFLLYRSLLISANVLLADLPDKTGDASSNLDTLAVLLSKQSLIHIILCLSMLALIVGGTQGLVFDWPALLYIDLVGTAFMIIMASKAYRNETADSHFLYGYVNDLIIGWPLVPVTLYWLNGMGG